MRFLFFLLFLFVSSNSFAQKSDAFLLQGLDTLLNKTAPKFNLKDINGATHNLDSMLVDSVVVINFWATVCSPCVREIPSLNELVAKYKDSKVAFLAISNFESARKIKLFSQRIDFKYNLIAADSDFAKTYQVGAYPSNIVIDKKGNIIFVKAGYKHDIVELMSEVIDKALKE